MNVLAVMERRDLWGSGDLGFILYCVGVVGVVAVLAFFPIRRARIRGSRWVELIVAAVVLWGAVAIGFGIYAEGKHRRVEKEREVQIRSGYFDPQDVPREPVRPWELWVALAAAYVGLLVASGLGKAFRPRPQ